MRDEWEIREKLKDDECIPEAHDYLTWVLEQTEHMFNLGERVMYCEHERAVSGYDPSSNMYQIFYNCVYMWVSEDELEKIE